MAIVILAARLVLVFAAAGVANLLDRKGSAVSGGGVSPAYQVKATPGAVLIRGYCQQMLEDVKKLERERAPAVLASAGNGQP